VRVPACAFAPLHFLTSYNLRAFPMRIARRYTVTGDVQGVGFRYFSQAAAVREQIDGWVRNTPLGTVEILAEGQTDAVERFERQIRRGPPSAVVTDLIVTDAAATLENGSGFRIR
jgi:acylphosphatase